MPPVERAGRSGARCSLHPGVVAVSSCDECGRPMCLACAIPVRGRVIGNECLQVVLGSDAPRAPIDEPRTVRPPLVVAGWGFAATLIVSALPWSNAVTSSNVRGLFGSWEISPPSWSLLAAAGALAGLLVWTLVWFKPALRRRSWAWVMSALAAAVIVGALLFLAWPPVATHPWLGPWLAIPAAALAIWGSVTVARRLAVPSKHGQPDAGTVRVT